MEPIVVFTIIGFVVVLTITLTVYSAWERKYIKTHFMNEKQVFVAKKNVFSEGEKHKKYDYYIEADVDGKRNTYHISKKLFDQIEEGNTYTMTMRHQEITSVES